MSMDRAEFLNSIWVPYPPLEEVVHPLSLIDEQFEGWTAGRLIEMDAENRRVAIVDQGRPQSFVLERFDCLTIFRGRSQPRRHFDQALNIVLLVGDIILLKLKGLAIKEVVLLSPSSCEPPKVNCDFHMTVQWDQFVGTVRREFRKLGLIEVATPSLVKAYGVEPYLWGFETKLFPQGESFYLPTSPELSLKKLLCAGWSHFFEIKSVFRNEELSPHHQPEFHILEWYRAYRDLETLFYDLQRLLNVVVPSAFQREREIRRTTVRELFREFLNFDLQSDTSREELVRLSQKHEIHTCVEDSWDELFHRMFIEKIEPHLGHERPLWVQGYPPSQAALSRVNSEGWADRAELYWRGVEIANGYNELNDPDEYERRLKVSQQIRREANQPPLPEDPNFLKALRSGCPPAAGMALGLDRLFMILVGKTNIREIKPLTFF